MKSVYKGKWHEGHCKNELLYVTNTAPVWEILPSELYCPYCCYKYYTALRSYHWKKPLFYTFHKLNATQKNPSMNIQDKNDS
jgi:hypothetical protein